MGNGEWGWCSKAFRIVIMICRMGSTFLFGFAPPGLIDIMRAPIDGAPLRGWLYSNVEALD